MKSFAVVSAAALSLSSLVPCSLGFSPSSRLPSAGVGVGNGVGNGVGGSFGNGAGNGASSSGSSSSTGGSGSGSSSTAASSSYHSRPYSLQLGYISTSFEENEAAAHHHHYSHHHPPTETENANANANANGQSQANNNSGNSHFEDVLDMNISEDSIRKHYQEWCSKFHRRQDSFRFIVFQRNYLSQFKWNLAAGKKGTRT
jgi:hypothetical protein